MSKKVDLTTRCVRSISARIESICLPQMLRAQRTGVSASVLMARAGGRRRTQHDRSASSLSMDFTGRRRTQHDRVAFSFRQRKAFANGIECSEASARRSPVNPIDSED